MSETRAGRLFVSLYLDEDVSALIATLVRARGFTALTTLEADRISASDAEQLEFAIGRGMALLTHNRADFEALARQYVTGRKPHCGLIIAVRRTPYDFARRLLALLNRFTADEMDNQVLYI